MIMDRMYLVNVEPRCMVGRICGTTSCGSYGFREDFLKKKEVFPRFKSIEAYDSMASIDTAQEHGWQELCR